MAIIVVGFLVVASGATAVFWVTIGRRAVPPGPLPTPAQAHTPAVEPAEDGPSPASPPPSSAEVPGSPSEAVMTGEVPAVPESGSDTTRRIQQEWLQGAELSERLAEERARQASIQKDVEIRAALDRIAKHPSPSGVAPAGPAEHETRLREAGIDPAEIERVRAQLKAAETPAPR